MSREHHAVNLARGFELYASANDDPEDTLFLQLTQREVTLMGILFVLLQSGVETNPHFNFLLPTMDNFANKVADAMAAQKTGGV